jgi:PAS domain S-box-containing protein
VQLVDNLIAQHRNWVANFAEPMIARVRAGLDTHDAGMNLRGKAGVDAERAVLRRIVSDQRTERNALIEAWKAQVRHTLEAVIGSSLVIGLLIGAFARDRLHLVSRAFQETLAALRRNAHATHESEQRLRTILNSIGDGVIVCDSQGRIELLNPVAEKLTGYSQDDAFHRPLASVFRLVEETTREPLDIASAATDRTLAATEHALLLRRDDQELQIDRTATPVYGQSGSLGGSVIVFRDISEQRRTQAALLASEKMAVAGRLAATIAHEIHNPLDSVVNLLYLMKAGVTPEEQTQFIDMASGELDRVTQISRSMLGMYRESRVPVTLDIADIFASLLILLDPQLSHSGVRVASDLEDGSLVSGFPAELRQVFTNLLTNAADASPRDGRIDVIVRRTAASTAAEDGAQPRPAGVFISITDHGPGISPDIVQRLFQPFFTTKGEHGTGLGLWVSLGIVQKHNGTIRLDSRTEGPDHGTTVGIFLPRGETAEPTRPSVPTKSSVKHEPTHPSASAHTAAAAEAAHAATAVELTHTGTTAEPTHSVAAVEPTPSSLTAHISAAADRAHLEDDSTAQDDNALDPAEVHPNG